jgi:hypothetical protein
MVWVMERASIEFTARNRDHRNIKLVNLCVDEVSENQSNSISKVRAEFHETVIAKNNVF